MDKIFIADNINDYNMLTDKTYAIFSFPPPMHNAIAVYHIRGMFMKYFGYPSRFKDRSPECYGSQLIDK